MSAKWTSALSTGVRVIDEQHKQLFSHVNKLHEAMSQGKGKEEIGQILDFLGQYAAKHFSAEEREMQSRNCPTAEQNKQAHREFMLKFSELRNQFDRNGSQTTLVLEIHRTLSRWLVEHISKIDTKLNECVAVTS